MAIPLFPFLYFFSNPPLLTTIFWQYRPNEIWDKRKNKRMRER